MADESELSRFRQQWKEEVTARTKASSSSSSSRPPTHKPKVPHFSRGVRAPDDNSNNDEYEPPTPSSPQRRPSISTATSGIPRSALEHYEKAVEKESEGNLGESLKLYRKAFRMDDGVDKSYKEKYFPRPAAGDKGKRVADTSAAVVNNTAHHTAPITGTSELVASFSGLAIEAITKPSLSTSEEGEEGEREKKFSLLASVPSELLLQILRFLALTDVAAFVRLSQVCKHLCYLVASEERIWAELCRRTFARQIWDWKVSVSGQELFLDSSAIIEEEEGEGETWEAGEEDEEEKRVVPVDDDELARYNGSWREMFHLRPRLRYNGIYISTCNYHRPGGHSGTSLSWGTPVHIVTYYRYLRFYPDGTLLSLLTTHGPSEVVYAFSKSLPSATLSPWAQHVSRGRWRIDKDGRVDVETEASNLPRYLFRMQLRVRNVKGRGGVKLVWDGFWSWNKLTDDLAVFEGRNDKPFFFSRVSSVEREEGFV
ncbi:hypothetical protein K440DRAFT_651083 [Wilcoxina mikolae CBS 423.85]|nr:hypothetical protein K440DRAFT_651083 [Wilcoxina mikolae CBS 423.85]